MIWRFLSRGFGLVVLAVIALVGYGFVSGDIIRWQPIAAHYVTVAGDKISAMRKPHEPEAPAPTKPPAVTVIAAKTLVVTQSVIITGTLVAEEEVVVGVDVDGQKIIELAADQGDHVKKGQVLARLDRASLEVALAQNDAALAKSDVAIAQAQTQVTQAELSLTDAQTTLDRTTPLQAKGYATTQQLDTQTIAMRSAKSRLENARAGLDFAHADRKTLEASRKDVVLKLSKTELKAPTDGLVLVRNGKLGQLAAGAGEPVFRIARDGQIELDAEVTETAMHDIQTGQMVKVTPAGFAKPLEGTIRLVTPQVDQTTRLGHVRVRLPDDPALRVGSFARGRIVTARHESVALPLTAIQVTQTGATAQVVRDGRIETRQLVIGIRGDGLIEVVSGVSAGEAVVSTAGTFVRDGDLVTPILAAPGTADTGPMERHA